MKLFGTDGIRGMANVHPMTAEVALKVGKAAGLVFSKGKKKTKIIIGKDTRRSGYLIESALMAGLIAAGCEVYLVGPYPTPGIAHIVKSFAADAGIVISASHNPFEDNGIKFFDANGWKLSDEVEKKIEELALGEEINTEHIVGELVGSAHRIDDARGRYIEFAKNTINNRSLKGLKIVLDCANGAAYHISKYIFKELGAHVIVTNASPNGKNINENCGALHPDNLSQLVTIHKADVGIALDGDADRVIMVDEKGKIVDGDELIAIAAANLKNNKKLAKDTVVVTVMSNLGFLKSMQEQGISVVQTKVGDRHVLEEMKKNGYSLGGEQSGHITFLKHTTTGDGTITALKILDIMKQGGKKLSELAKVMTKYPQVLVNVEVKEKKEINSIPSVKKKIDDITSALGDRGRLLVRYSGTQKMLRIMLEGESTSEIEQYANEIAAEVRNEIGV